MGSFDVLVVDDEQVVCDGVERILTIEGYSVDSCLDVETALEKLEGSEYGVVITDRESFEKYEWRDPDSCNSEALEKAAREMPDGMKAMCSGPGGLLENAIKLCGYDNLCYMLADDPDLAQEGKGEG